MSILIHGMSLPKDGCKSCGFDIYGSCLIKANMDKPYEVTHSCPLIELPPHGRLGDLDKLHKEAVRRSEKAGICDNWYNCTDHVISASDIENAPTIIPADPEGGGDA